MEPYPESFFKALEDWLNLDSRRKPEVAEALIRELEHVEPVYKECTPHCYRRMDFPKDPDDNPRGISTPLLDLLHTGRLTEEVSSWTTSRTVAMNHMEGVQKDSTCVIFWHDPRPEEVRVNLRALLSSPRLEGRSRAIELWMTKEEEVVLEVAHLTPEDVCAWGGFVGSLEQLRFEASILGCTSAFIDELENHLKNRGIKPG